MAPLAYDLYSGLGGWAEGFIAEGWRVVGFDNVPQPSYPGEFRLRDVLTIDGAELKDADCLVASPPCQAYSYRAMPWKRAKALPPPSNELFDACFRIQREACEAAGRYIPMVVENVRGAQKWVGRAKWNFGSYFLWGDVPALMPNTKSGVKIGGAVGDDWFVHHNRAEFERRAGQKREGRNFHAFENGLGSSPSFNGAEHETRGVKSTVPQTGKVWSEREVTHWGDKWSMGIKVSGLAPGTFPPGGLAQGFNGATRMNSRRAASAMISKIPFPLAVHIARMFKNNGSI